MPSERENEKTRLPDRAEYVKPPLQGFALIGTAYRAMTTSVLPNGEAGLWSESLGLFLWLDGPALRFYNPETGRNLRTPSEEAARADAEVARRRELEAEIADPKERLRKS